MNDWMSMGKLWHEGDSFGDLLVERSDYSEDAGDNQNGTQKLEPDAINSGGAHNCEESPHKLRL